MAHLAVELAERGHSVAYVAEQLMSEERAQQGWFAPDLGRAELHLVPTIAELQALLGNLPPGAHHICQGLRGNGLVGVVQQELEKRQIPYRIVMEMVDDTGWRGIIKKYVYQRLFAKRHYLQGVLAIGDKTAQWVQMRGVSAEKVHPFAYFLPRLEYPPQNSSAPVEPFKFLFVGQLIERKRVALLLQALGKLHSKQYVLQIIGSGPLEDQLQKLAASLLPHQVEWLGKLSMDAVRQQMAEANCLVLPSRHDGWGAVVSEALMVGTPAICSDTCGAAEVVRASGEGGVFPSGDQQALTHLLATQLAQGRVSADKRQALAHWAKCLGAEAGAHYLTQILQYPQQSHKAPWLEDIV